MSPWCDYPLSMECKMTSWILPAQFKTMKNTQTLPRSQIHYKFTPFYSIQSIPILHRPTIGEQRQLQSSFVVCNRRKNTLYSPHLADNFRVEFQLWSHFRAFIWFRCCALPSLVVQWLLTQTKCVSNTKIKLTNFCEINHAIFISSSH